jgi:hypothetical protein
MQRRDSVGAQRAVPAEESSISRPQETFGTRHDFVGAHHVEDPPRRAAPAEAPSSSSPRETTDASPGSFGFLLGGRSFSSDIRLALSSGVLTPEASFSGTRHWMREIEKLTHARDSIPLQVSNA